MSIPTPLDKHSSQHPAFSDQRFFKDAREEIDELFQNAQEQIQQQREEQDRQYQDGRRVLSQELAQRDAALDSLTNDPEQNTHLARMDESRKAHDAQLAQRQQAHEQQMQQRRAALAQRKRALQQNHDVTVDPTSSKPKSSFSNAFGKDFGKNFGHDINPIEDTSVERISTEKCAIIALSILGAMAFVLWNSGFFEAVFENDSLKEKSQ